MADDPHVLALIEQFMQRQDLIKQAQAMLDDPGRVGVADHLYQHVSDKKRQVLDQICSDLCGLIKVPMAAVTLVNSDQQMFLGACGLGREPLARDHSLCMFVAASGHSFEMNDLTCEEQETLPAYMNDGIRAYLGRPLLVRKLTVGSLCVVDRVPRDWTDLENQLLTNYAAHVSSVLEEET